MSYKLRDNGVIMNKDDIVQRAAGQYFASGKVDILTLAKSVGLDVFGKHTNDDFNACIEFDDKNNKFYLYVNTNHPINRIRFSIAHELAHFILHENEIRHKKRIDRKNGGSLDSAKEKEADVFAAEILMPQEAIEDCLNKYEFTNKTLNESIIVNIASKFKVSLMVAILRLKSLDYSVPYIQWA